MCFRNHHISMKDWVQYFSYIVVHSKSCIPIAAWHVRSVLVEYPCLFRWFMKISVQAKFKGGHRRSILNFIGKLIRRSNR